MNFALMAVVGDPVFGAPLSPLPISQPPLRQNPSHLPSRGTTYHPSAHTPGTAPPTELARPCRSHPDTWGGWRWALMGSQVTPLPGGARWEPDGLASSGGATRRRGGLPRAFTTGISPASCPHGADAFEIAVPDSHGHQWSHADVGVPDEAGRIDRKALHALEGAPGRVKTAPELALVLDAGGSDERLVRGQGEFEVADHRGRQALERLRVNVPGSPPRASWATAFAVARFQRRVPVPMAAAALPAAPPATAVITRIQRLIHRAYRGKSFPCVSGSHFRGVRKSLSRPRKSLACPRKSFTWARKSLT